MNKDEYYILIDIADQLGKDIEYILPAIYSKEPLFVISMKKK